MGGLLRIFLYLLGILWVAMGSLMVFVPDLLKTNVFAKLKGIPLKKCSAIPIIISILLFLSASYSRFRLFIVILGILILVKGILFIVATDKMQQFMNKFVKMKSIMCRILGVVIIILGSIVLMGI